MFQDISCYVKRSTQQPGFLYAKRMCSRGHGIGIEEEILGKFSFKKRES